ncbi:MAG: hypothetical protein NT031_21025, partial [Planctomycetota bacterium]|nr:hypothetical protein [Planctomycetota bacterium]
HAAIVYGCLADLEGSAGTTAAALENQGKALAVFESLARAAPDDADAQEDLARALERLGGLLRRMDRTGEALAAHRRSLDIRQRQAERDSGSASARRALASARRGIGSLWLQLDKGPDAEDQYRQALADCEALAKADPESSQARRDLAIALTDQADALMDLHKTADALEAYGRAMDIQARLAQAPGAGATARRDLAIALARVGQGQAMAGQLDRAGESLSKSLEIHRSLLAAAPEDAERRRDVAVTSFRLGGVHAAAGRLEPAEACYAEAVELYAALAAKSADVTGAHDLSVALNRLGDVQLERNGPAKAAASYTRSFQAAKAQADAGSDTGRRDSSYACGRLAGASIAVADLPRARQWFLQKFAIEAAAAKAAPAQPLWRHDGAATVCSQVGGGPEAARLWGLAIEAADALQRDGLLRGDQKELPSRLRALASGGPAAPGSRPAP